MDKTQGTLQAIEDQGFNLARMISFSKSGYIDRHPEGQPVFNANIVTKVDNKKIWHGDLDVKLDKDGLQQVANQIGEFAVLREFDGRFENEDVGWKAAEEKAVVVFKPQE